MAERLETCPACRLDVSVPEEVQVARCPKCDGPLERAATEGSSIERTVLAWRPKDEAPSTADTRTWHGLKSAELADPVPVLPKSLEQGSTFGPYILDSVLGKGGMGVVYKAHQPNLQRWVALKVLTAPSQDEEDRRRFLNEARAAARLSHPNIVPVHDVGSVEGRDYFTMDLVEGMTLHEAARRKLLTPERVYEIVRKVALAVDHAHEQGIIHRDLKPGNILLDKDGEPRVTDFGLAKDLSRPLGLTLTGVALGSPPYMPPEQARGAMREVDHLSDVYSLGAVLYECLTGEPPFTGANLYEVVARIQNEDPAPPRKRNAQVSLDGETVVLRCLEKEKWRRYPTAGALARDLERLLKGEPIHAMRASLTTRIARRLERHLQQVTSLLLMGSVMVGLATYLVATRSAPSSGTQEVRPEVRPMDLVGPLEDAERCIERSEGVRGFAALARFLGPGEAPRWRDLRERGQGLPDAAREALERALARAGRPESSPDERADPDSLDEIAREASRDRELDASSVAEVASLLFASSAQPALGARAAELALVHRALGQLTAEAVLEEAAPAFRGAPSPLDFSLARALSKRLLDLRPGATRTNAFALARLSPRLATLMGALDAAPLPARSASGALERFEGRERVFRFPPVPLVGEGAPLLLGRGAPPALLAPTLPVRALDGRRLVVGWLRFLLLLDERGRIVERRRLPGRAVSLGRAPDGVLAVACDPSGEGTSPLVRVRSRELETLDGEDGKPVPEVALDAVSAFANPFEMRPLAVMTTDDTTNPWVRAERSVTGTEAAEALRDPSLTPFEKVALACRLDARGFSGEAEEALADAREELLKKHAYVPALAGYGTGDAGLEIAAAIERLSPKDERRIVLAAWRDAFAPVLADGKPRQRIPFVRVPPPDPEERPPKGIGGLDGAALERLRVLLRFQREFVAVAGVVALLALMRWRRQQARDLAKIGARTATERWLLYLRSPGIRIGFAFPTYIGAGDKLAFLLLYLAYLAAFAVQDSALKACTEVRRAPQALLVGLPAHPQAARAIAEADRAGLRVSGLVALSEVREAAAPRRGLELVRERDRVVLGATRWWSDLPRRFAALVFPIDPGASVREFRAAWPEASAEYDAELASLERVRNGFFWVIPSTILLFLVALLVPTRRPFAPGPEDLQPPPTTRALSYVFPGAPQFMTGRPVRGVLLLAPFLELAQTAFNRLRGGAFLPSVLDAFTGSEPLAARLVAESPESLAKVRTQGEIELALALLLIFALHWADLALARRKAARLAARSTRGKLQLQDSGSL